jgi:hypothetical protein
VSRSALTTPHSYDKTSTPPATRKSCHTRIDIH